MSARLPSAIVMVATEEIGVTEVNGTNCGVRVNQYKASTTLPADEPWPWCAAFVCWVVREAAARAGVPFTATFKRPTTAGAYALETWSLAQDASTWTKKPHRNDIEAGDIVVFKFSHTGIAVTAPDKSGHFKCIEANTGPNGERDGDGAWKKTRHIDLVRSRIRFTV